MIRRTTQNMHTGKPARRALVLRSLAAIVVATGLLGVFVAPPAHAAATYMSGYISNITLAGDDVFIQLNSGLPDNCAGTGSGWMRILGQNKPMVALVLGLFLRGDKSTVSATVYTNAVDASGYCSVNQIDPVD